MRGAAPTRWRVTPFPRRSQAGEQARGRRRVGIQEDGTLREADRLLVPALGGQDAREAEEQLGLGGVQRHGAAQGGFRPGEVPEASAGDAQVEVRPGVRGLEPDRGLTVLPGLPVLLERLAASADGRWLAWEEVRFESDIWLMDFATSEPVR